MVNISWEDAAAYLNWLSEKDNLQPFYVAAGETFAAASPPTNGYRLPTEAEWAFSARILGQPVKARFPWGNEFPPPEKSGNFADESARGAAIQIIQGFNDGFPVSSPVGNFPPNRGGFYDMGGNISEWCHDYYSADTSTLGHQPDPLGPASGLHRVVRGSNWRDASIKELRLSYRAYQKNPKDTIGFRMCTISMIIRILTLTMLLAGPGIVLAQDPREDLSGKEEEKAHIQQENAAGQEQPRWPIPFNPSQEIGADSQVSFPTDI